MRIAVVTPLFPVAGQPYRGWPVYQTVEALSRLADVHVVCPSARYPLSRTAAPGRTVDLPCTFFDYPAVPLLSRPWNGAVCARLLRPHLERLRPDLVLNYWLYPEGYAAVRAARALGVPVMVGSRGSDLRRIQDSFTRSRTARTVREADHVLTVSEDLRRHAIAMGAAPERVTSIRNGTEFRTFHWRDREEARRELGMDGEERIVLYVGRFIRAKGLIELLDACARLAAEGRRLRLVCLGSGPLRESMLARAADSGISSSLHLPGDQGRAEVARWLNAADLLCLPSYSEGCPNVVLEALSCGCPVVASDVGGIPEVADSRGALLVPPRDVDRLAGALRDSLSRDWDRREIASCLARSWDDVAQETFAVCRQVSGIEAAALQGPP
jgi:teichuronic acid biosynthesis glycosyltransferase TuaC